VHDTWTYRSRFTIEAFGIEGFLWLKYWTVADFDTARPSIARVYDYLLGGKDNFAVDRDLADQLTAIAPAVPLMVRENRELLTTAVRWVAGQGVSQFVDLGCGMPTEPSTAQSALDIVPDARVVYIDNDPIVVSHLTTLVRTDPAAVIVDGDVNDPDAILGKVAGAVDLARPVCLLMGALLHFYDPEAARDLVALYTSALAPGSYAVLTVCAAAPGPDADKLVALYSSGPHPVRIHTAGQLAGFFGDLELMPPGVADARAWRPGWDTVPQPPPRGVFTLGGMARVPG
jgi:hypothetical protein